MSKKTIAIFAFIGIMLTGLAVAASTLGWGVERPKEDEGTTSAHTRTFYGGFYYPFYSRGVRSAGSGVGGGGFRGGK